MASSYIPVRDQRCIPLCYPNNYRWDSVEGCLEEITPQVRSKMVVCEEALQIIRSIEKPVCVVSIVGDRRTGKSYIISQLQEPRKDECIFGISSRMKAKTIGIWMNCEPFTRTLEDGTEVAVILLDTEGQDSIETMGEMDNSILILTVLLSSLVIYNGTGIAKSDDLIKLRCVVDIASRQISDSSSSALEIENIFPSFMWLLRDVILLPTVQRNGEEIEIPIREYIVNEVLLSQTTDHTTRASIRRAEIGKAILNFFPVFDAFSIPYPSDNPDVLENIEDPKNTVLINDKFHQAIDEFITTIRLMLRPKLSLEGHISGKQFSDLIEAYTKALDCPGGIPHIISSWQHIVENQLKEDVDNAVDVYKIQMDAFARTVMPCSETELQDTHRDMLDLATSAFSLSVTSTFAELVDEYYEQFRNSIAVYDSSGNILSGGLMYHYIEQNNTKSESVCKLVAEEILNDKLPLLKYLEIQSFDSVNDHIEEFTRLYEINAAGPKLREIMETELMDGIMEFHYSNHDWLSSLHGYQPPSVTKEKQKEYKGYLSAIEEKQRRKLQTERLAEMERMYANQVEMHEKLLATEKKRIENTMKEVRSSQERNIRRQKQFMEKEKELRNRRHRQNLEHLRRRRAAYERQTAKKIEKIQKHIDHLSRELKKK